MALIEKKGQAFMRRVAAIVITAALGVTSPARAGIVLDSSFNINGTPYATIERSASQTSPAGGLVQESVYAGNFSVTATGWTSAGPFDAFCVDLWHSMSTSDPHISAVAVSPVSAILASYFHDARDSQVGNEIAFLMRDYATSSTWTADQRGGFQLALWYLIDKNFQVVSTSTPGLLANYRGILGLFGNQSWNGLSAYDSTVTYDGGTVFEVTHSTTGDSYQDLVTSSPGGSSGGSPFISAVPEPSTLATTVCAAGIFGIGSWLRRRRRATA
jgi:hypothetical protein